jgi:hypothetical protein
MYKIFKTILSIIWVLDIINLPQLEFLDTTMPINGLAWFLIWLCLPSTNINVEIGGKHEKENV